PRSHRPLPVALVGILAVLVTTAALATAATAAGPVRRSAFNSPVSVGFPGGDDWEPSIAADRFGHLYAFWTHYIGYNGGTAGDPDPTGLAGGRPPMDPAGSDTGG